jgi:hypothetical protein
MNLDESLDELRRISYVGPPISDLDEMGRRLYFCDLWARGWLIERAWSEFQAKNFEASAMLIHAEVYLADRLAYELAPWPKGKIQVEPEDDYARLRHE